MRQRAFFLGKGAVVINILFQATYVYLDCFHIKPIRYIECNKLNKKASINGVLWEKKLGKM